MINQPTPVEAGAAPLEDAPLVLRPSRELAHVPTPRQATSTVANPMVANAQADAVSAEPPPSSGQGIQRGTWLLMGAAMLASLGWMVERRRRRLLEIEKDSVLWADVQPPGSSIVTTAGGLNQILPDSPNPAEAARAIYVTAIGETNSRREATLIDLHQLDAKLSRRRQRGDNVSAVLLLQEHLVNFRYTSPWVFLELRELYKALDRGKEWEVARQAFGQRFSQNAPAWDAPSTAGAELLADTQLCHEVERHWPYREARMFVLHWMLGEQEMRHKGSGPPLLALGIYRDLMLLDTMLDDVMDTRTVPADSLL
ncbi:MAG: hypothetical protein JWQ07_2281 [Ramlibacter sp.]|nr:hypothetical protein [Ramlibacter sp.]